MRTAANQMDNRTITTFCGSVYILTTTPIALILFGEGRFVSLVELLATSPGIQSALQKFSFHWNLRAGLPQCVHFIIIFPDSFQNCFPHLASLH
jgi:hypothetical protein